MADDGKDITAVILSETELVRDIEGLRKRCLQLPMVADCEVHLVSFKGRPLGDGRHAVDITGSIKLTTRLQVGVTVDAAGSGEIDAGGRTIAVKDVRILNDFHGVLGKALSMAGYASGRSFNLRPQDSERIRAALAA